MRRTRVHLRDHGCGIKRKCYGHFHTSGKCRPPERLDLSRYRPGGNLLLDVALVGSDAYTTRADEQGKKHETLLKILSQLQSPSGHEKAKNQDTPVQEAPAAGDDGEMSPSNDGGSVVPAEAETEWISLAEEDKLGTLPP